MVLSDWNIFKIISEIFIQLIQLCCVTNAFIAAKYCVKSVGIRSYSGPYFTAFGMNTER